MLKFLLNRFFEKSGKFTNSTNYWRDRYEQGGNSGDGSYRNLADFKAEIINGFVTEYNVRDIIEYGCGDGNQLRLARYPRYIGFDVSPKALEICSKIFCGDESKTFKLVSDYGGETAELTISLDVILHLVEDDVFDSYMERLFGSSTRYVIIYSSNHDSPASGRTGHVRHRRFTDWIERRYPGWVLVRHIPNRYPFKGDTRSGSQADFYIYAKNANFA